MMNQTQSLSTYDCIETLTTSGVPEKQAKAYLKIMNLTISHYLENIIATKTDLSRVEINLKSELKIVSNELRHEMQILRKDVQHDMDNLRRDMKQDMNDLRSELKGEMNDLRSSINHKIECFESDVKAQFKFMNRVMAIIASGMASLIVKAFVF